MTIYLLIISWIRIYTSFLVPWFYILEKVRLSETFADWILITSQFPWIDAIIRKTYWFFICNNLLKYHLFQNVLIVSANCLLDCLIQSWEVWRSRRCLTKFLREIRIAYNILKFSNPNWRSYSRLSRSAFSFVKASTRDWRMSIKACALINSIFSLSLSIEMSMISFSKLPMNFR